MTEPKLADIAADDLQGLADWLFNEWLHHTREAQEKSKRWEAKKPKVKALLEQRAKTLQIADPESYIRKSLKEHWDLGDLMDAWSWHEREAKLMAAGLAAINDYLCACNHLQMNGGHEPI